MAHLFSGLNLLRLRFSSLGWVLLSFVVVLSSGCAPVIPPGLLRPSPESLALRQLQTRQFETSDEKAIISACAAVAQDLGYTLDDSETKLGLIVASKDADATDGGQVALALTLDILSALNGQHSDSYGDIDDKQKIKLSIVTRPQKNKILTRVTFQRVIWNKRGVVSRLETLTDQDIYRGFFESLSKAVFLEAQNL